MTPSAPSSAWICPACRRRVPGNVAECRCGFSQALAGPPPPQQRKARRGFSWDLAVLGACCLLIGALAAHHLSSRAEEPQAAPSAAPAAATEAQPAPPPPALALGAPARPSSAPAAKPQRTDWALPALHPQPFAPVKQKKDEDEGAEEASGSSDQTSVDAARARGERALDQAMAQLAGKASRLVTRVHQYSARCENGANHPACGALADEIEQLAVEVGAGLEVVEDEARRSWLEPGKVRQIREKYGLDDHVWDQLARFVRQYAR